MKKNVNGFWFGGELGELEKLCINSWIKNGYEFYLWVYDLDIEVPDKVVIANANHIVSFTEYFTYSEGHSRGTPVAFSNLFRAQLLYQKGGLYIDLDVLCLKPYDFSGRFVFSEQVDSGWDYHVATCILYSENKGERIFEDWSDWIITKKSRSITHGDLGPNLITPLIISKSLTEYVLPKEYFCPVDWQSYKNILHYDIKNVLQDKPNSYGIHLFSSLWDEEDYKNIGMLK
tara:strand:- start:5740 stop:6432 length:693 start_codon:yes stop_codon:yes gene_type:complete